MKGLHFFLPFLLLPGFGNRGSAEDLTHLNPRVHRFIKKYCIECHGPEKEKGDRVFHEFPIRKRDGWVIDTADEDTVMILEEILDQLNLGEMPPDKEGVRQPRPNEIRAATGWLTKTLLALEEEAAPEHVVMRRLNRREYRNTVRDLLGLDNLTIDPTKNFPEDENEDGFTNIGEALNLTDAHLDEYLNAAETWLTMAFRYGKKPPVETIRIAPKDWGYPEREETTPWMYRLVTPGNYLDIGAGKKQLSEHFDLGTYPRSFANRGGIRVPGYYRISITAEAVRRLTHPYDPEMIPVDLTPPMQLALYVARSRDGLAVGGVNARQKIAMWDLRDDEARTFERTVWLDRGAIPFINWDNGPGPSDYWMRDILAKYHDDVEFRGKQGSHAWHIVGKNAVPGRAVSDVWKGPVMRVHDFVFTGPLGETWDSFAKKQYLETDAGEKAGFPETVMRFAQKAFRRPVPREEIAPYLQLAKEINESRKGGWTLGSVLKAMMISPDFLYLKEGGGKDGELTPWEVASRLSYFLWSSMPDDELFALAESGEILKPQVLRKQALRMLADPKNESLIEGLAGSWLRFDKLGSMPPDSVKFQEYYRNGLDESMRRETLLFLGHMIRENRPITEFLDCDYSFLNEDLARHYGIDGVEGSHFRKVSFPAESPRGGLLGHASILTLSANGVDTSPVVRGIWVLENILGTPPPPPPPDVEPLDPDVRGATTIRQRLEKHSSNETCADCHATIDPFGFPLEFYDPVGGYRETYFRNRRWSRPERKTILQPGRPVNGFARLPSGETFKDPDGLKRVLLQKEDQFRRALTERLMTCAIGRKMTFRDEEAVKKAMVPPNGGKAMRFRDLLLNVVRSEVFTRR